MTRDFSRACKIKTIVDNQNVQECKLRKKRISEILSKHKSEWSSDEVNILKQNKKLAKLVESQRRYHSLRKQREEEFEDDGPMLRRKCGQLAELIRSSQHVLVYTGAGISTSASIPDYRGPNGVWTLLKNGYGTPKVNDLVFAEPTFTHLAISELVKNGTIKHVVSQNCDGLHLRSGVPQHLLSEIHGNMFIEVCKNCNQQYIRSFDVTERTSLRKHETGRKCHVCEPQVGSLIDTIVHFGERGRLKYPLNWQAATAAADKSDLIVCLGSSLKILRKYNCLWPKNRKKLKLVIVNLQWTPKDSQATIKINGKCDEVMREVAAALALTVPPYDRLNDPVLYSSIHLRNEEEEATCNRVKLNELARDQIDQNKVGLTPGWFGKGMRKK